jgi:hypothetical protein
MVNLLNAMNIIVDIVKLDNMFFDVLITLL